jgi:hypothetical protein
MSVVLGLFIMGTAAYVLSETHPYLSIATVLLGITAILAATSTILPA